AMVAVRRKVALVPAGRLTVVSRAPVPLPAVQLAPPLPLHVQLKPLSSGETGSVTRTPATLLGPVLPTAIEEVGVWPGTAVDCASDFVIVRLATGAFSPTDACAVLLPVAGSGVPLVALATFTIGSGVV